MLDFPLAPGGYRYRGLTLKEPMMRGWDVYALQTALRGLGSFATDLALDGTLGTQTQEAIDSFQNSRASLKPDGVAGTLTQRELAVIYLRRRCSDRGVPLTLAYGQAEHESSFWLGNQSPLRPDGSADCGVVQRNDSLTAHAAGFNVPVSIGVLAAQLADKHTAYRKLGVPDHRAWELAAGSWNAPAWADAVAGGKPISDEHRAALERYIDLVAVYYNQEAIV